LFFEIKGRSTGLSFKKKQQVYITRRIEHHHTNNKTLHHHSLGVEPEDAASCATAKAATHCKLKWPPELLHHELSLGL
jgi:hypothetical protein